LKSKKNHLILIFVIVLAICFMGNLFLKTRNHPQLKSEKNIDIFIKEDIPIDEKDFLSIFTDPLTADKFFYESDLSRPKNVLWPDEFKSPFLKTEDFTNPESFINPKMLMFERPLNISFFIEIIKPCNGLPEIKYQSDIKSVSKKEFFSMIPEVYFSKREYDCAINITALNNSYGYRVGSNYYLMSFSENPCSGYGNGPYSLFIVFEKTKEGQWLEKGVVGLHEPDFAACK